MAISINPNMFGSSSPFLQPPPPPPPESHLPMLYYGLIVVGAAAFVLALYNLIVIKWCSSHRGRSERRENRLFDSGRSRSFPNMNLGLVSSFKYKKEGAAPEQAPEYECAVCLSAFEEGEDVRKLPKCKHSFHAPCIDMWLYSHSDCPLCRAKVDPGLVHSQSLAQPQPLAQPQIDTQLENRRVELGDPAESA